MNMYCVRAGHQQSGEDIGADGFISEYEVTRNYEPYVVSGLKRIGITAADVTPPEASRTLSDSLMYGINKANSFGADYFISCHANCSDNASAHGCEVVYLSEAGRILAERICTEISALGFYNRGPKPDERGLAELHKTDGVAVIIEPFFVSNAEDVALFNKVGGEKLGYAIAEAITGKEVITTKKEDTKVDKIIIHSGGADQRAAEYLADALQCPIVHKDNLGNVQANTVIVVGGVWKPSDSAILVSGADRYETVKAVLKYIGKL